VRVILSRGLATKSWFITLVKRLTASERYRVVKKKARRPTKNLFHEFMNPF